MLVLECDQRSFGLLIGQSEFLREFVRYDRVACLELLGDRTQNDKITVEPCIGQFCMIRSLRARYDKSLAARLLGAHALTAA